MLNSFEDWLALVVAAQLAGRLLRTFSPIAVAGVFLFLLCAGLMSMITSREDDRAKMCKAVLAFYIWFGLGLWA